MCMHFRDHRLNRWICAIAISTLFVVLNSLALSAEESPATFYRGLNLNGPALVIDGRQWEGNAAKNVVFRGSAFENQSVPLKPRTDRQRSQMLRSSRWGRPIEITLTQVPAGTYQVFLYVWEDNDSTRYQVTVNDKIVVEQHHSGEAGQWSKLGPWAVTVTDEMIKIKAEGGDANLSGIEIWSGAGPIPQPATTFELVTNPTADQLAFFESKIRPLLSQHCYSCHSADAKEVGGNLWLDSRPGIVRGGDTEPPILADDPDGSLLLTAVRYTDEALKMPPSAKLSSTEIADLETWIRMGAPDPRLLEPKSTVKSKYAIDWDQAREFWSFQPIRAIEPPPTAATVESTTVIDRFILDRLKQSQLTSAARADRPALIRRATYDLTGLPPTPEEIEHFTNDPSPDAFATVIDRLLASPRYGERWGRYWLDVVRYADTAGDNSDFPIPQMYKYRDWVIDAFNRDLPYHEFVREQLAGDLLTAADEPQRQSRIIATGYIANARRFGSRVSDYPQHLTIEDTLDDVGRAFLGLSINCARCHDHKFDPITSADYYALYGIFQSTRYPWPGIELEQRQRDLVPLASVARIDAANQAKQARQAELNADVKRLEAEQNAAQGEDKSRLDKAVQAAKKLAESHAKTPPQIELAYAVADRSQIEDARIQVKGDPNKTGARVPRRFLTILGGMEVPANDRTSGRLQLANWITDPANPLTARVMVNRIWQSHFGRGLVPTPNDFGKQGQAPTHPELLDWLASQFIQSGWSIKSMHRTIMLSQTYQRSSHPANAPVTPEQIESLAVYPSRRLDAEAIRDTLLVLSGNLASGPAGPHPFPPQSEWKFTQHNPFKAVYESNHRSVYLMTQRIQRHPYLAIFDGADPSTSTGRRFTSTTPLQALFLLNDPFVHEQSRGFAERLTREQSDDSARIVRSYLLAFGRKPDADEVAASLQFLNSIKTELQTSDIATDQVETQTWQAFTRALFRLNEFVYLD